MTILKGELQDDAGNVLYTHTSGDSVFMDDGKTVEQQMNVLSDTKENYFGRLGDTTDFKNLPQKGIGQIETNINAPVQNGAFNVVYTNELNRESILATHMWTGDIYSMIKRGDNTWLPWKQMATTDKIDILVTDMLNTFSIVGGGFITPVALKVGNTVSLDGVVSIGALPTGATNIFRLPVGYRPEAVVMSKATTLDGLLRVDILPDGYVQFVAKITGGNNTGYISLNGIGFEVI